MTSASPPEEARIRGVAAVSSFQRVHCSTLFRQSTQERLRKSCVEHDFRIDIDCCVEPRFLLFFEQDFTVEPDRIAVDEKQIQLEEEQKAWLYAAIDVDSKVVLHARLSQDRGPEPAATFLRELKEEHRVAAAVFLVDGMGYLTALAKTDLTGDLNYSERNLVEKLFQTYTMRVGRFHETWNGSQPSAERWLTAYVYYYNHLRSHQALDNQPPIEAAGLS